MARRDRQQPARLRRILRPLGNPADLAGIALDPLRLDGPGSAGATLFVKSLIGRSDRYCAASECPPARPIAANSAKLPELLQR